MKTRSKAIRTALKKYNALASKMDPPAPILQWKDVMNYAFISEFDLLHHAYSHKDISQRPWALQMNREIAAKYHKIKCARDEIVRLNIECRQLQTHIRDEEAWYLRIAEELAHDSPLLAAEVRRAYKNRRRVNRVHQVRLEAIYSLNGFTGLAVPGVRLEEPVMAQNPQHVPGNAQDPHNDNRGVGDPQEQLLDARGPLDMDIDAAEANDNAQLPLGPMEEMERAAVREDILGRRDDLEVAEDEELNGEMEIINDFVEQLAIEPVEMRRGVPVHMMNRFRL